MCVNIADAAFEEERLQASDLPSDRLDALKINQNDLRSALFRRIGLDRKCHEY